jgi:hypothetical protein
MFAIIDFAARMGLGAPPSPHSPSGAVGDSAKHRARHIEKAACRFDVLAIETRPGQKPVVRLHKGAFNAGSQQHRTDR